MKKELRKTLEKTFGKENLLIIENRDIWTIAANSFINDAYYEKIQFEKVDLISVQPNGDSFVHFSDDTVFIVRDKTFLEKPETLIEFLKKFKHAIDKENSLTIVFTPDSRNIYSLFYIKKEAVRVKDDIIYFILGKNRTEVVLSAPFDIYKEIFFRLRGRYPWISRLSSYSFKVEDDKFFMKPYKYDLNGTDPFELILNEVPVGVAICPGSYCDWVLRFVTKDKEVLEDEYDCSIASASTLGELKTQLKHFFGFHTREGKKSLIVNYMLEEGLSIYISYGCDSLKEKDGAVVLPLPKNLNDKSLISDAFVSLHESNGDFFFLCDLAKEANI